MRATVRGQYKQAAIGLAIIAALNPTVASAGSLLGALAKAMAPQPSGANHDAVTAVTTSINATPNAACELPRPWITKYLSEHANDHGLIDNVSQTVFQRSVDAPQAASGMEALMRRTNEQTQRKYAQDQAAYKAMTTGTPAPLRSQIPASAQTYDTTIIGIEAVQRLPNGLLCNATAQVDFVRFPIVFDITIDRSDADGWNSNLRPVFLNEDQALDRASDIRVMYDGPLTLAEARRRSDADRAQRTAEAAKAARTKSAAEAYRNSPAGRAQAAANLRALSADYKRRGLACQNSGGTWGFKFDSNTVMEVAPGEVPNEIMRFTLGCYHL